MAIVTTNNNQQQGKDNNPNTKNDRKSQNKQHKQQEKNDQALQNQKEKDAQNVQNNTNILNAKLIESTESIEAGQRINSVLSGADLNGDGKVNKEDESIAARTDFSELKTMQVVSSGDLADQPSQFITGMMGGGGDGNSSTADLTADAENVVDVGNYVNEEQGIDEGLSADVVEFAALADELTTMNRKEMLELLELSEKYLNDLMQRNPAELQQAHAAVQSAIAMYLLQIISQLTERDEEEEEEEEAILSAQQTLSQFIENSAETAPKKRKKKSKYLANIYEIPLLKSLMKGDSVKRQHIWKLLDQHLENQVGKEEVREEMFKYSF